MVKVMLFDVSAEVPPPYMPPGVPGFVTVTATIPAAATSESGTFAINWFALTWVVVSTVLPQLMVALPLKLLPLTVRTTPVLPAGVRLGERAEMAGFVPAAGGVLAFEL